MCVIKSFCKTYEEEIFDREIARVNLRAIYWLKPLVKIKWNLAIFKK